jgi:hypothetical protein
VGDAVSVGAVVGSGVCVGSVVDPVAPDVPVLVWALTTTPPVTMFVVVPDDVVPFSGSDVAGVVDGSVEVCVSVVVVPVVVVVVLVLVVPLVVDVSDAGGFEVVSSAEATPYPVTIAVPTPNATASPPTRPMWAPAPMLFLHEASPPSISDMGN